MRITRKEVAKYAGVSEQTVSYILNGSRKFSDDIVARVQNAIQVLHYKPDMIAKSMVTKRTNTVAFIVRDIANPIFPSLIHGFQERACEFGYSVYISDIAGRVDIESQIADLVSRRIDGVYLSLMFEAEMKGIIDRFLANDIKVVVGNKNKKADVPCVRVDFNLGMQMIVEYLSQMGHKDIVYLDGLDAETDDDERRTAFTDAYSALFGREPYIVKNSPPFTTNVEDGYNLTSELLSKKVPFTALVATNDLMAYGVIDCLRTNGYKVPQDVSVVGIDDILYSKYINPPLTTLGYDYRKMGWEIFDALKFTIDNGGVYKDCLLKPFIVERATVKKIFENF